MAQNRVTYVWRKGWGQLTHTDQSNMAGGLFLHRKIRVVIPEKGKGQCQANLNSEVHCVLLW